MPAARNVLVVGGGAAGAASAILLVRADVAVELIEIEPEPTAIGSGITLQGNGLRVLRQLGVWEQLLAAGYPFDTLGLRASDAEGTLLVEVPDVKMGGPDLPATLGVPRPVLARILLEEAASSGVDVRFGVTFTAIREEGDGVQVEFSDGSSGRYDLVIGADGVRSATRQHLGIDLEIRATGMGIWRAFGPRPDSVTRTDLYYGGPSYIAGYCPTGPDSLYAYVVEPAQDRSSLSAEERLAVMRELAAAYHGPWDDIRATLTDPSRVNYTRFETHVLSPPWNRGRVVLIGDAAHCCPPTLAQGASLALEDAAVLADLVSSHAELNDAFWAAFIARRFNRVKTVVDASNQLCRWLIDHEQGDVPGLLGQVVAVVTPPA